MVWDFSTVVLTNAVWNYNLQDKDFFFHYEDTSFRTSREYQHVVYSEAELGLSATTS